MLFGKGNKMGLRLIGTRLEVVEVGKNGSRSMISWYMTSTIMIPAST